MSERKTASILQRVPVILAVTAASYGLQLPPQAVRPGNASGISSRTASATKSTSGSITTASAARKVPGTTRA